MDDERAVSARSGALVTDRARGAAAGAERVVAHRAAHVPAGGDRGVRDASASAARAESLRGCVPHSAALGRVGISRAGDGAVWQRAVAVPAAGGVMRYERLGEHVLGVLKLDDGKQRLSQRWPLVPPWPASRDEQRQARDARYRREHEREEQHAASLRRAKRELAAMDTHYARRLAMQAPGSVAW